MKLWVVFSRRLHNYHTYHISRLTGKISSTEYDQLTLIYREILKTSQSYIILQRTWTTITILLLTSYLMTLHKSKRWKNYYCYVPRSNRILLLLVRTHQWQNYTHISSENNLPVKSSWCTYYRYANNYDKNRCYEYGVFHDRFKLPLMMVVVFKTCLGEKLMLLDVKLFLGVKNISPLKISSKPESNTYVYT